MAAYQLMFRELDSNGVVRPEWLVEIADTEKILETSRARIEALIGANAIVEALLELIDAIHPAWDRRIGDRDFGVTVELSNGAFRQSRDLADAALRSSGLSQSSR